MQTRPELEQLRSNTCLRVSLVPACLSGWVYECQLIHHPSLDHAKIRQRCPLVFGRSVFLLKTKAAGAEAIN